MNAENSRIDLLPAGRLVLCIKAKKKEKVTKTKILKSKIHELLIIHLLRNSE